MKKLIYAAIAGLIILSCQSVNIALTDPPSAPAENPILTEPPPVSTEIPTFTQEPTPTSNVPPPATLDPSLPTYSEVLATYPPGADFCNTDAFIKGGDDNGLSLSGTISMRNNRFVYQCYGTKLTAGVEVTLEGRTYLVGTKLTVDADLRWIAVSTWD
jgi:hypothetical protein